MTSHRSQKHLPSPVPEKGRAVVPKERVLGGAPNQHQIGLARSWRPGGPWGRALKIAGAVVVVMAFLAAGGKLFLSSERVATTIAERIKDRTGYDLVVNGATRLTLLPRPRVVMTDAHVTSHVASYVTDPAKQTGSFALSIATLTLDLSFDDFLGNSFDVTRIALERPILTVQRLRNVNDAAAPTPIRFAKAQAGDFRSEPSRDLRIEKLKIADGTLIVAAQDMDEEIHIERIDAALSVPSLSAPVLGRGTFEWNRRAAVFSFQLETPADLRDKQSGRLQVALETPALEAQFDGTVTTGSHPRGTGRLSAKAQSLPAVWTWLRQEADLPPSLGDGELDGFIDWSQDQVSLTGFRFAGRYARGKGEAVVTLKEERPHIRAALAFDHLDLGPFLEETNPEGGVPQAQMQSAQTQAAPQERAPRATPSFAPNGDWFSKPGATRPAGRQPMLSLAEKMPDAALAQAAPPQRPLAPAYVPFDADINLNIREAHLDKVHLGPGALSFDFQDGLLLARLSGLALYGGNASGTLTIDTTKPTPDFAGNFRLDAVQAGPLLADAAQFELVAGRTKLTMSVSGEGNTAPEIKSSLKGTGAFVVTDGAFEGIDITGFIRGLGEGRIDLQQAADAKTEFSEFSGSFIVNEGVARTDNLNMRSPLLKVSAAGDVDLRDSTLQILATPEIVAGPAGSGGANDLAGLSVPVRIEGPLADPRIQPQVGAVFANPKSASRAVSRIGAALQKKFKGKQVGEFIGRLLGGGTSAGGAAPQALAPPQPAAPQ